MKYKIEKEGTEPNLSLFKIIEHNADKAKPIKTLPVQVGKMKFDEKSLEIKVELKHGWNGNVLSIKNEIEQSLKGMEWKKISFSFSKTF